MSTYIIADVVHIILCNIMQTGRGKYSWQSDETRRERALTLCNVLKGSIIIIYHRKHISYIITMTLNTHNLSIYTM